MVPNEQLICARWIEIGTRVAFACLVATFALYLLGGLEPLVPTSELVRLWTLSAQRYVAATGAPTGWAWLRLVGKGDYLNMLSIMLFVAVATACYARLAVAFVRDGKRAQAYFALLQVLVLLAAASGAFA